MKALMTVLLCLLVSSQTFATNNSFSVLEVEGDKNPNKYRKRKKLKQPPMEAIVSHLSEEGEADDEVDPANLGASSISSSESEGEGVELIDPPLGTGKEFEGGLPAACSQAEVRRVRTYVLDKIEMIKRLVNKSFIAEEISALVKYILENSCADESLMALPFFQGTWEVMEVDKQIAYGVDWVASAVEQEMASNECSGMTLKMIIAFVIEKIQKGGMAIFEAYVDPQVKKDFIMTFTREVYMKMGESACDRLSVPSEVLDLIWTDLVEEYTSSLSTKKRVKNKRKHCSYGGLRRELSDFVFQKLSEGGARLQTRILDGAKRKEFVSSIFKALTKRSVSVCFSPYMHPFIFQRLWDRLHMDSLLDYYVMNPAYDLMGQVSTIMGGFESAEDEDE